MRIFFFFVLTIFINSIYGQDSAYARRCIKFLTSAKCFGRGYVKNGLQQAENFIVSEIKKNQLNSLFGANYTQSFVHSVNTFPKKCELKLNGKKLTPGIDFILDPSSKSVSGNYTLVKKDSLSYQTNKGELIKVNLKKKLTYSVALEQSNFCRIDLDKKRNVEEPLNIELKVEAKQLTNFVSKNIGCYIPGSANSDSLIIFSAHYDHLGGMGKNTFFPGANDNASGTSLLLDLMRYYKTHTPKYKTVFLFFAGEEAGLLGSKYFTKSNALDLTKIKFLINLDLLGTGDDGIMVVNGAILEKEFATLTKINDEQHLIKQIKKRGKAANSDHYWFSEAGVPSFFIYTMGGITAYHDVLDIEKTLPLTDYVDVFKLLTLFTNSF